MKVLRLERDLGREIPEPQWPPGVTLAPAAELEAEAVHALLELAYQEGFGSVPPFDEWWSATSTDSEYDSSLCVAAVAADGSLAAYALVWNSAFIKDLVVHPAWRRRGLGSAMLDEVATRLKHRGFRHAALKVQAANSAARALYEISGFVSA